MKYKVRMINLIIGEYWEKIIECDYISLQSNYVVFEEKIFIAKETSCTNKTIVSKVIIPRERIYYIEIIEVK